MKQGLICDVLSTVLDTQSRFQDASTRHLHSHFHLTLRSIHFSSRCHDIPKHIVNCLDMALALCRNGRLLELAQRALRPSRTDFQRSVSTGPTEITGTRPNQARGRNGFPRSSRNQDLTTDNSTNLSSPALLRKKSPAPLRMAHDHNDVKSNSESSSEKPIRAPRLSSSPQAAAKNKTGLNPSKFTASSQNPKAQPSPVVQLDPSSLTRLKGPRVSSSVATVYHPSTCAGLMADS